MGIIINGVSYTWPRLLAGVNLGIISYDEAMEAFRVTLYHTDSLALEAIIGIEDFSAPRSTD